MSIYVSRTSRVFFSIILLSLLATLLLSFFLPLFNPLYYLILYYTKDLLVCRKANRQYSRFWFSNWWKRERERNEEMKCDTSSTLVVSASSSNDNSNIYINTSFGFFFPKASYFNDQSRNSTLFSFWSIKKPLDVYIPLTTDANAFIEKTHTQPIVFTLCVVEYLLIKILFSN